MYGFVRASVLQLSIALTIILIYTMRYYIRVKQSVTNKTDKMGMKTISLYSSLVTENEGNNTKQICSSAIVCLHKQLTCFYVFRFISSNRFF